MSVKKTCNLGPSCPHKQLPAHCAALHHDVVHARHVLCVVGQASLDNVEDVLPDGFTLDRDFSLASPDARMMTSFAVGALEEEDIEAIRNHSTVAYILSPPLSSNDRRVFLQVGHALLKIIALLLATPGAAAKHECIQGGHSRQEWLCLEARATAAHVSADMSALTNALRAAFVVAWEDGECHFSIGMHLLGWPDVEIPHGGEEWMLLLVTYMTMDAPARPFLTGEGFAFPGRRLVITRKACLRFPEDDFSFNPHGYVRLDPEPEAGEA